MPPDYSMGSCLTKFKYPPRTPNISGKTQSDELVHYTIKIKIETFYPFFFKVPGKSTLLHEAQTDFRNVNTHSLLPTKRAFSKNISAKVFKGILFFLGFYS